jgi:two-component system sensor kinase FixL
MPYSDQRRRQKAVDESATSTTISAAALSVFIVIGVSIGAFMLQRQTAIRELRAANDQLSRSRDGLEEREAHLEAILATVPDAMVVIDEGGIIQSFSSAAQTMFGYGAAEASGKMSAF